jgi:hypothetical protein
MKSHHGHEKVKSKFGVTLFKMKTLPMDLRTRKSLSSKELIVDIIVVLFIMLFIYAATSKLIDIEKFRVQLGQSPLLTPFVSFVSWVIPLLEILISFLVVFKRTRLLGLYMAFTLMILFSFYIVAITGYGEFIPCSCGGVLQHMSWHQHLIFNLTFVCLGGIAILLDSTPNLFIAINRGHRKPVKE